MTSNSYLKNSIFPLVRHNLTELLRASSLALAFSPFLVNPAWAEGSVLSGMFDGSEPVIAPLVESACTQTAMGYRQSVFEVSTSGIYHFRNAFGNADAGTRERPGVGVTVSIYQGRFDAFVPRQNQIVTGVFDIITGSAMLSAGTDYVLVVQQGCSPKEGFWGVTFTGPGQVTSEDSVSVPAFTSGTIATDAPITTHYCWGWWDPFRSPYQQTGPVRVSRDGAYYFSNAGPESLCLSVFTAPVDPDDPWANYVTSSFWETIELEAGRDYYFIAQPGDIPATLPREFFYILAPPAPFRINHGLSDSWFNPDTPGQGFFLDVFEQSNLVFLGWFTYTDDPAADDGFAQRWMTASGPFSGTSAQLAIDWTTGGAFDSALPEVQHFQDGTIELEFTDCRSGLVRYAWGGQDIDHPAVSGVIPIERIANDAVALCESLYRGPGTPGPL